MSDDRVTYDPVQDASFSRVVGKRKRPKPGDVPTKATRDALGKAASYATGAPKGVYRFYSHEEANRDRDQWTVERALKIAEQAGTEATRTNEESPER